MFSKEKERRGDGPAEIAARGDSSAGQNLLFGLAVLLVVGIFGVLYNVGKSQGSRSGGKKTLALNERGDYLRGQLRTCQNKTRMDTRQASTLKGESRDLYRQNRQLEEENDRLVKLNENLEKKNVECAENAELTKQAWQTEDKENMDKLNDLDQRNKELRNNAKRLSGTQGMRTILLLATIKKLAKEHTYLRKQNRLPTQVVDKFYISELVRKWKDIDARVGSRGGIGPMSHQRGQVLAPNRTEMWSDIRRRRRKVLDHYDPDRHAKVIFLPKRDPDTGDWSLPGWNGRYGTQNIRHGTFVESKLCPITDLNRQMRVLYEYALCAVGNNLTSFMYPNAFKRCKDCHTEYLTSYIETPLVLFCDDCRPMHTTNEFKLLCAGYTSQEQYGTKLFWRTRSRLRFKGRYLSSAEAWLRENGFSSTGGTTMTRNALAIRLPTLGREERCKQLKETQQATMSYSKLLKDRDGVKEYHQDFDGQCNPSISSVAKVVNKMIKRGLSRGLSRHISRVYVSTDMPEDMWESLQQHIDKPVFRHLPTGHPTEDDIVDTYIAASCPALIINRFDIKSAHITEAHMLLNAGRELSPVGTHVW